MPSTNLSQLLEQNDLTMTVMADGTGVLLDLRNETLLTFNETGSLMFSCLKGGKSEAEIVSCIIETYAVDQATAQADLASFMAELARAMSAEKIRK